MTYLHIFQQEEYDGPRFLAWMRSTGTFDKRASLVLAALYALSLVYPSPPILVAGFMALALLLAAYREADPRKSGKKKLAMTQRATRILRLAFALLMLAGLVLVALRANPVLVILLVQAVPFSLVAAVRILQPQRAPHPAGLLDRSARQAEAPCADGDRRYRVLWQDLDEAHPRPHPRKRPVPP